MAVSAAEARGRIISDLAGAIAQLGFGTACLGEAYEQLDDATADRLEAELFRPIQKAYGRAKRTQSSFAGRFGLEATALAAASPGSAIAGGEGLRHPGGHRRRRRPTAGSPSCRTRCCRSRPATPSCAPGLAEVRELLDGVPAAGERVPAHVRALGGGRRGSSRAARARKCSTSSGGSWTTKSTPSIAIRIASQPRSSSPVR